MVHLFEVCTGVKGASMQPASLLELWRASTDGTPWCQVNVARELQHIDRLAVRPRIPDDHLIFRIFRAINDPKKQIKVVLLGQDPYPEMLSIPVADADTIAAFGSDDPREEVDDTPHRKVSRACGFSFSSPLGSLPFSLRIMIAEILREYPQPLVPRPNRASRAAVASDFSGDLSHLVADGVFLLNTFLTIERQGDRGMPKSHTSWVCFTTQILNFIRRTCPNAVYLALGKQAADLLKASGVNDAITTDHPANARFGGRTPFVGSDIFRQANALLETRHVEPIDWIPMKDAVDVNYFDDVGNKDKRGESFALEEIAELAAKDTAARPVGEVESEDEESD